MAYSQRLPIIEITAHRGDHSRSASENTIQAFQAAADSGATGLEFDIILTRDGHLVINHDFVVTAKDFNGVKSKADLRNMNLSEIEKLTHKKDGSKIPTLEGFFETLKSYPQLKNMTLHLEIKNNSNDLELKYLITFRVLEFINFYRLNDQVIVRSFDWDIIELFKINDPSIKRGLLIDRWSHSTFWQYNLSRNKEIMDRYQPTLIAPHKSQVTRKMVNEWTKLGVSVNPYTVNTFPEAEILLDMGVTGLTTDFPREMNLKYKASSCTKFFK